MGRKYKRKDVLTTGEVAKICKVAPRTVSKWFDSGQLRGYRIPGSRDRRIPVEQLIKFMKAHGMPLDGLETGQTRVLIIEPEPDLAELLQTALTDQADYEVKVAHSAFEAGAVVSDFAPHVILVDTATPDINPQAMIRFLRANPDLQDARLVAVGTGMDEAQKQHWLQQGFHACLGKPFEIKQIIDLINNLLSGTPSNRD